MHFLNGYLNFSWMSHLMTINRNTVDIVVKQTQHTRSSWKIQSVSYQLLEFSEG